MRTAFAILLLLPFSCIGQIVKEQPSIKITRTTETVLIDGILDENIWETAEVATDFVQNFPADTSIAESQTEVMVCYDADNIYIAAICYDELEGDYIIQSLKRDFSYPVSDAFAVFIDPFDDKLNGFSFAVNPLGVQREGLLQNGAERGVTTAWDNKWYSAVTNHNDKWIVEMAIPFKSIRFKENVTSWGINFSRNDLKRNENSSWSPVPRNFNIASLAFTGELIWDEPLQKAGANVSIIPYAITNFNNDYSDESTSEIGWNAGADAKIAITSSLNLDLTINPDFSQVEVDRQVTNLSRFSLFFPERRQFFIENSDLFGEFGFRQIRPFFSRNIGLKSGTAVPILGGARLSGKVNQNWRIGFMNVQTEGVGNLDLEGQNYTVAVFQRKVWVRSNIAGIFVNRQGFNGNKISFSDYNRVAGIDFNLASANGEWMGKAFYHQSFTSSVSNSTFAHAVWLMHNSQNVFGMWNHEYVGENYLADIGFVPRNEIFNPDSGHTVGQTYFRIEPKIQYKFYPASGPINYHGPALYINNYYDSDFKTTDHFYMPHYIFNFNNTAQLEFHYHEFFTKLRFDFDITYSGAIPLPAGNYYYRNGLIKYNSDKRKKLNGAVTINYGGFYNGTKLTVKSEINYRQQPWGIFSITLEQNNIWLPDSFAATSITVLGPKIELSFTKSMFFTTFIQYNTQIENVNVNARFQWRFKPMSDLYIVYTENYNSYNIGIKNRALVVKLVYWINV